jgi:hypothetical protein
VVLGLRRKPVRALPPEPLPGRRGPHTDHTLYARAFFGKVPVRMYSL